MSMKCPGCGQTLVEGEASCWNCGFNLKDPHIEKKHYCPKCGKPMESDDLLCPNCKFRRKVGERQSQKRKERVHEKKSIDFEGKSGYLDLMAGTLAMDAKTYQELSARKPWPVYMVLFILSYAVLSAAKAYIILYLSPTLSLPIVVLFQQKILEAAVLLALLIVLFLVLGFILQVLLKFKGGLGMMEETYTIILSVCLPGYLIVSLYDLVSYPVITAAGADFSSNLVYLTIHVLVTLSLWVYLFLVSARGLSVVHRLPYVTAISIQAVSLVPAILFDLLYGSVNLIKFLLG